MPLPLKNHQLRVERERRVLDWPPDDDPVWEVIPSRERLEGWAKQLVGEAVFPWSADYDRDRRGDPLFQSYPRVIAYCETPADVAASLELARAWGWPVTCRSGGHSTAGYSVNDGLVVDVSRISYVSVDADARLARVGAGTPFQVVDSVLDSYRLHFPGGGCGAVCVGGFVQGGGYGFTSRMYGMSSDNVVAFTLMKADGTIVVADAGQEKDLFWAVRGGTGNNFGVLLEVAYRLFDLWEVWGFGLSWPLSRAPEVLALLQQQFMGGNGDRRLGHQVALATVRGETRLTVFGMYHGTGEEGRAALDVLLRTADCRVEIDEEGTYADLNEGLLLALLDPPTDDLLELKRAGYLATKVGVEVWREVVDHFATTKNRYNLVVIEAYGGAINAVPAGASAFIHRDVDGDFFVDSFFDPADDAAARQDAQEWLDGFFELMAPYLNGHVYQNYPQRGLADYRSAYWGDAAPRLASIRRDVDPGMLLRFEQNV